MGHLSRSMHASVPGSLVIWSLLAANAFSFMESELRYHAFFAGFISLIYLCYAGMML